jgi:uncharacterized membrane protein YdbT with pleckstrin-like domain
MTAPDPERFKDLPHAELFAMAEGRTGDITAMGLAKAELDRRQREREKDEETCRRVHDNDLTQRHIALAERIADQHARTAGRAMIAAVASAVAAVALAVIAAVRFLQHP